jgi:CO/xanthine dehydrogenase FAD-binding subunit
MSRSFTSAATLDDALAAIGSGARPIAGGTDLVVGARQGKAPLPDAIVAIDRIEALHGIAEDAAGLRIGALTTHEELAASPVVRQRFTALADASAIVGSHATRANGTLGGNVVNASPAMDTGAPLLCFGAEVTLRSAAGERTVPLGEFWTGPGSTAAEPTELLVGVDIPAPGPGTGSAYVRLEYRRQMEIAVVGAAAALRLVDGVIADARVAITALSPTIRRVPTAEDVLNGSRAADEDLAAAARAAAGAASPISDVRGSAEYRTAMAEVIARRAIATALARARGEDVGIPASASTYGSSGGAHA